ncbi:MAG: hypothetical protein FHOMOCKG_00073 [Methanophagales virus GBV302]|uniref:DNA-binding protein n=1 Tax=Methanophagales virus GBV302 TaxID=2999281 RepID=A0A9E8VB06_9CAUD|nr:MAG: hypothetical protein QIT37_gp073 [Methanophagales virus GBV302]WAE39601.1 MAG: hypothetical protein FHOMOCKG_00073 [Methanophagales virus GBV302]
MQELYIGEKPYDNYLRALGDSESVSVLARGKNIKKAIDVALMAQRLSQFEIRNVVLYDEKMTSDDGEREYYVSAIRIDLSR